MNYPSPTHPHTKTNHKNNKWTKTTRFGQRKLSDLISCAAYFKFMHSSVLDKAWNMTWGMTCMKMTYCRAISREMQPCLTSLQLCFVSHPHTFLSSPLRALSNIHFAWEYCWIVVTQMCIWSLTRAPYTNIHWMQKKKKRICVQRHTALIIKYEFRLEPSAQIAPLSSCSFINSSNGNCVTASYYNLLCMAVTAKALSPIEYSNISPPLSFTWQRSLQLSHFWSNDWAQERNAEDRQS